MMRAAGSRLGLHSGLLGLTLLLWLAGCMSDRELAVMRNDVDRMNRQLLQLHVAQEVAQGRPREIVQRELESDRRIIADLKVGVDELKQQVGVLSEKIEETEYQLTQRITTLESRLKPGSSPTPAGAEPGAAPAGQPPPPAPPTGPTGSGPVSPPPQGPSAAADARRVYQAARSDYDRGKFDLAAQGFRAYLTQAPHGDVADSAQYYLAGSLESAKDFRNAIAEYDRLVRDFPQSSYVPKAMYRAGLASYALKDSTMARRWLRTVSEQYPHTVEAKLAQERLQQEDRPGATRPSTPTRRPGQ